jgi:hypothetical protein
MTEDEIANRISELFTGPLTLAKLIQAAAFFIIAIVVVSPI